MFEVSFFLLFFRSKQMISERHLSGCLLKNSCFPSFSLLVVLIDRSITHTHTHTHIHTKLKHVLCICSCRFTSGRAGQRFYGSDRLVKFMFIFAESIQFPKGCRTKFDKVVIRSVQSKKKVIDRNKSGYSIRGNPRIPK